MAQGQVREGAPAGGRKAVVLFSGGLDSTTVLAIAKAQGFSPVCLSVDYGQRHRVELERAAAVARAFGVPHRVVRDHLKAGIVKACFDDPQVQRSDRECAEH